MSTQNVPPSYAFRFLTTKGCRGIEATDKGEHGVGLERIRDLVSD